MKKYLLVIMALLGIANLQAKTLRVGTNATYPPFESFNEKGELVGFDIDLLNSIAKKLNYKLEYIDLPFEGLIQELESEKVDLVISCLSETSDRKKKVNFSDGYMKIGVFVIVKQDNNTIKSAKDLKKGIKLGVETGSSQVKYSEENYKGVELVFFNNVDIYTALETGKVDAILMDDIPALAYLKSKGKGKLKIVGDKINPKNAGMAFNKKNTALLKEINKALKEVRSSGEYKKIYDKWI
ncbi:MAG: transporter substrate-binding domain-containing protein [Rickettsiales bacterium]|jgi:ABC-type amino acid transport substrate-binding protein|nr:transporter substrate-binding domain-containing protein [Rickettsiales bacterium]